MRPDARLAQELDQLRAQSQFRSLDTPAGINLMSNDYLGLAMDPRLKRAVLEAVAQAGSLAGTGSRLLSGNAREWLEAERTFAEFAGSEAALYFGSGYTANIGLLGSILKPGDTVFSDSQNHASIIDGIRLSGATKVIYPHRDLGFLANALRETAHSRGPTIIVSETLFSMEGDVAPIEELLALARQWQAALVLDEAHATGVWGPEGRGIASAYIREREILAVIHTCSKALASVGAFVCGTQTLREYLINRARTFIFSTATPPYVARQIEAAVAIARGASDRRRHLEQIATLLRHAITSRGFDCGSGSTHLVPVILGSNDSALHFAAALQRSGFAVRAIRPPTVPPGTARIRFSLNSRITAEQIQALVRAMEAARESLARAASETVASAVHA